LFLSAWYAYDLTLENLKLLEHGSKEMCILPTSYFATFTDSKQLVGLSIVTTSPRVSGVAYDTVIYCHDYNTFVHHFIFHMERMLQIQTQSIEKFTFGMRLWYSMKIQEMVETKFFSLLDQINVPHHTGRALVYETPLLTSAKL